MIGSRFRPVQWISLNRDAECDVRPTTWPLWACGDQPVLRSSRVPSRPHHATRAWRVKIASRTADSENITTS